MAKPNRPFSCVVACYNAAPYLGDCLESVIVQDYRPIEVVVVNDCSTDNFDKLIRKTRSSLKKHDVSLKVVSHSERLGYATSMRDGTMASSGAFIGILDADDVLMPGVISHVAGVYKRYRKALYVYTQLMVCDTNLEERSIGWCRAPSRGESILSCDLKGEHIYSHFKTFQRFENMNDIFFEGCRTGCDQWMGLKLEERGPGVFTNFVGYKYRENLPGSISRVHGTHRRAYWKKMLVKFVRNRRRRRSHKLVKPYPISFYDVTGAAVKIRSGGKG